MKKKTLKLFALILTVVIVMSSVFCSVGTVAAAEFSYKEYYTNRGNGLKNTFTKLTNGEEINIVYFGGSVTVGYGQEGSGNSWRELTGKWFTDNFPNATVNNIDVACGDTGSWFGLLRLENDVLSAEPDLVFIEFAINDYYYQISYEQAARQFETIVRNLRKKFPNCDIVNVLTTDQGNVSALYNSDKLHAQAQAHDDVAKEYGIPTVRVGHALVDYIEYAGSSWGQYVIDIVHPNNKGYKVYFEAVKAYLESQKNKISTSGAITAHALPMLVSDHLFDGDLTYIDATESLNTASTALGGNGFDYVSNGGYWEPYSGGVYSSGSNRTFVVEFTGTELIVFQESSESITQFEVRIGDKYYYAPWKKGQVVLVSDLPYGKHKAEITPIYDQSVLIQNTLFRGFFTRNQNKESNAKTIKQEFKKSGGKYHFYYDGYKLKETTLVKVNGKWFYIKNGVWDTTFTDLFKYKDKWMYVKNGRWSTTTDLIKYKGVYFFIKGGKWDKTVETLHKKNGKWFCVKNGKWYKNKAIVKYSGQKFYCNKGFAQLGFTGKVKVGSSTYKVVKGKVKGYVY